jgi:hypothetical protein
MRIQSSEPLQAKGIQLPTCLDHGLHVLLSNHHLFRRSVLQKGGRDINCSLDYGIPQSKAKKSSTLMDFFIKLKCAIQ